MQSLRPPTPRFGPRRSRPTPHAVLLIPLPPALYPSAPPNSLVESDVQALLGILFVLLLSTFFSSLRAALRYSVPSRVLGRTRSDKTLARMAPLLERADQLAASASLLKITSDLVFVTLLLGLVASKDVILDWTHLGVALAIAAPVILLFTESIPVAVARARGDTLLIRALPAFHLLQIPVGFVVAGIEGLRRAILRMLGLPESPFSSRTIVEGLREVIEDSDISGDLDPTGRELLQNVMEFGDVDVAAVMTPRTQIHAVEAGSTLEAALAVFAKAGHSRVPVYRDSIDSIIGTISALEATKAMAGKRPEEVLVEELIRPPYLVPETKKISELLTEFRDNKQKLAIVLDEYGGTAGIVTLGDVVAEIVGDIQDEYEDDPQPMRELEDGVVEVKAGLHVTDVNEALGLDIPDEQDFETLGGFVLAKLGHLPKQGERFEDMGVEYEIVEASDRRVLLVSVKRSA